MIVLDSSAIVAILRHEPEADPFLYAIAASDGSLLASVNLLETSMVLAGRDGDATAWLDLDELIASAGIEVVAQDLALIAAARTAFLRYGEGRHPARLNLGDCAAYALAKNRKLPLLFKGEDFRKTDIEAANWR